MKGKHDPHINIEKITDKLLSRAEYELEKFCLAVGIRFDDLAAAYAHAATERFGPLLHGSQQWSVRGQMQSVRLETTEVHQVELPALEGSRHPQNTRTALEASGQVPHHRRKKVKGTQSGWAAMTPEERSKEMRRRHMVALGKAKPRDKDTYRAKRQQERIEAEKPKRKWVFTEARRKAVERINKTKKAKRKVAYAKAGGDVELQRIYQKRYEAKKWNALNPTQPPKPIPPLPGKEKQAA